MADALALKAEIESVRADVEKALLKRSGQTFQDTRSAMLPYLRDEFDRYVVEIANSRLQKRSMKLHRPG